jgi:hypothetical protein
LAFPAWFKWSSSLWLIAEFIDSLSSVLQARITRTIMSTELVDCALCHFPNSSWVHVDRLVQYRFVFSVS